jgi:hypothetical protein
MDRAQSTNVTSRKSAASPPFTMRKLRQLALWATAAAGAMFIAVIAGRSDVGSQRIAVLFPPSHSTSSRAAHQKEAPAAAFDGEAAARELAQAVRSLAEDRDRLMTRIAALEHNLDDVTGSVTRQIEAKTPPWPSDAPPAPATPATIISVVTPVVPAPAGSASPLPPFGGLGNATPGALPATAYGIDLGGAQTVQALHARWEAYRAARPKLFEGLRPLVSRKEIGRSKRVQWRLVVGPLPDLGAATRLCASLTVFELFCQPTTFEGQHLAER